MAFDEVSFPEEISYGSRRGPGFQTFILELDSNAEERVSRQSQPRHRFDARYGIRDYDDLATANTFFIARRGAARGFRFKDPLDNTSAANGRDTPTYLDQDTSPSAGDDSTVDFQLIKTYTSGAIAATRTIEKPVSGTVVIAFDGVEQTSGWSVNTATGIVTFSVAPTAGVDITAGFEFEVPCRFGREIDPGFFVAMEDFDSGSIPSIPIIELLNENAVTEEAFNGGSKEHGTIAADISISESQGVFHVVEPTADVKVKMPDAQPIESGGPIFFVLNKGTSQCRLANSAGTNFFTLAIDGMAEVLMSAAADDSRTWYGK
jgi:uncharacterized protein (TIGR02217 family)